ncbi:MAG: hypothetical protein HC910_22600 [Spirulinaceae cyanobacterium SM2_1_0]|nr:hypothetical protein [Spirulinaceae cyanobacterium SM2_1_0]
MMYHYRKIRQLKISILIAVGVWLCLSSLPTLRTADNSEATLSPNTATATAQL